MSPPMYATARGLGVVLLAPLMVSVVKPQPLLDLDTEGRNLFLASVCNPVYLVYTSGFYF